MEQKIISNCPSGTLNFFEVILLNVDIFCAFELGPEIRNILETRDTLLYRKGIYPYKHDPFPLNGGIPSFFPLIFFFLTFFRVSAVVSINYYMCYFNISAFSLGFNVLVYQVNVTEVDVSAEIELW